jgi:hypothetical protein
MTKDRIDNYRGWTIKATPGPAPGSWGWLAECKVWKDFGSEIKSKDIKDQNGQIFENKDEVDKRSLELGMKWVDEREGPI